MSFVSILASKAFLTVVSDGRVQGADGNPIQEDYQKFISLGDFFLAFAGDKAPCEMFIHELNLQSPPTVDFNNFAVDTQSKLIMKKILKTSTT